MPLYYTDKSLEEVEKKSKYVSVAENKRRQLAETHRFEASNPSLVGRKTVPSKTGVGDNVLVRNPVAAPKSTAETTKPRRRKGKRGAPVTPTKAKRTKKTPKPEGWVNPKRRNPKVVITNPSGESQRKGFKWETTRGKLGTVNQSLDTIQTNLSALLQVIKQENKDEIKVQIFKSLDDSMDKLRKAKDGALPKGNIITEPDAANTKEGQATDVRISPRGGKYRHSSDDLETGSLHNAKFRV